MPIFFSHVTLVPELPAFFERYPEITLDLNFSYTAVDLIAEGYAWRLPLHRAGRRQCGDQRR